MTLAQHYTQIQEDFINAFLPLDRVVERCGSEILFLDDNDNLIRVTIKCVRHEQKEKIIQNVHNKRMALKLK